VTELVVTHQPRGGWAFVVGTTEQQGPAVYSLRVTRDGQMSWYLGEQPAKTASPRPPWALRALVMAEAEITKLERRLRQKRDEEGENDEQKRRRR
jgi:hypothetical protein